MSINLLKEELSLSGVTLEKVDRLGSIIFIGSFFSYDNESLVKDVLANAQNIIYCSPMEDSLFSKNEIPFIKYEVGSEVGVLALIAKELFKNLQAQEQVKAYLDELDEGYLSAESNVGEEEIEDIVNFIKSSKKCTIVFGEDMYLHPDTKQISQIVAILKNYKALSTSLMSEELNIAQNVNIYDSVLLDIHELRSFDGTIVYLSPKHNEDDIEKIFASRQFQIAAKINNQDRVQITTENFTIERIFSLDENIKGMVAILPVSGDIENYRYVRAQINIKD